MLVEIEELVFSPWIVGLRRPPNPLRHHQLRRIADRGAQRRSRRSRPRPIGRRPCHRRHPISPPSVPIHTAARRRGAPGRPGFRVTWNASSLPPPMPRHLETAGATQTGEGRRSRTDDGRYLEIRHAGSGSLSARRLQVAVRKRRTAAGAPAPGSGASRRPDLGFRGYLSAAKECWRCQRLTGT